jgi:hypothetical protein
MPNGRESVISISVLRSASAVWVLLHKWTGRLCRGWSARSQVLSTSGCSGITRSCVMSWPDARLPRKQKAASCIRTIEDFSRQQTTERRTVLEHNLQAVFDAKREERAEAHNQGTRRRRSSATGPRAKRFCGPAATKQYRSEPGARATGKDPLCLFTWSFFYAIRCSPAYCGQPRKPP